MWLFKFDNKYVILTFMSCFFLVESYVDAQMYSSWIQKLTSIGFLLIGRILHVKH